MKSIRLQGSLAAIVVSATSLVFVAGCSERHEIDDESLDLEDKDSEANATPDSGSDADPCQDIDDTNILAQITCDLGNGGAGALLQSLNGQQGGALSALGDVADLLELASGLTGLADGLAGQAGGALDILSLLDALQLPPAGTGDGAGLLSLLGGLAGGDGGLPAPGLDAAAIARLLGVLGNLQGAGAPAPSGAGFATLPELLASLTGAAAPGASAGTTPTNALPGLADLVALIAAAQERGAGAN